MNFETEDFRRHFVLMKLKVKSRFTLPAQQLTANSCALPQPELSSGQRWKWELSDNQRSILLIGNHKTNFLQNLPNLIETRNEQANLKFPCGMAHNFGLYFIISPNPPLLVPSALFPWSALALELWWYLLPVTTQLQWPKLCPNPGFWLVRGGRLVKILVSDWLRDKKLWGRDVTGGEGDST